MLYTIVVPFFWGFSMEFIPIAVISPQPLTECIANQEYSQLRLECKDLEGQLIKFRVSGITRA